MKLSDFVGTPITASLPFVHPTKVQIVTLHGVEAGGVWIESQELTTRMLKAIGTQTAPETPVFFVPYNQIGYFACSIDVPALNEQKFGG